MRTLILLMLIVVPINLFADYVVVRKNTSIRLNPVRNSERIESVSENHALKLLDDGVQNRGYYHVKSPITGTEGWIYRSLLRYVYGDMPTVIDGTEGVEVTVIDVGAGLSCLIELPDNKYMVYDAGYENHAYNYINENIPSDAEIEYLILSHTDADHWGSVPEILSNHTVNNILYTRYRNGNISNTLRDGLESIDQISYHFNNNDLSDHSFTPGEVLYDQDGVRLIYLSGFGSPPNDWDEIQSNKSKLNNSVSVVVKLEYSDQSILFAGDAVGRIDGQNGCIATEEFMNESIDPEILDSDVLIAAHHGADNASCTSFIESVSPRYVVFSAGNKHRHPRGSTAERFMDEGVLRANMFRTDRGYYESGGDEEWQQEWTYLGSPNGFDRSGDDHIQIFIPNGGQVRIGYEEN